MLVGGFDRIALEDIGDEGGREGIAGTDSISYLDTGRFDVLSGVGGKDMAADRAACEYHDTQRTVLSDQLPADRFR